MCWRYDPKGDGFHEYFKGYTGIRKDVHRIAHQQLRDHWYVIFSSICQITYNMVICRNFWNIWFGSHGKKNFESLPAFLKRNLIQFSPGFSNNNSEKFFKLKPQTSLIPKPEGYRRQFISLINPIISFNQPKKINYFNTKVKKILKNNLNTRLKNLIKKSTKTASVHRKRIGKKTHSKLQKTTKPKSKKIIIVRKKTVKKQAKHLEFRRKKTKRNKLANGAKHRLKRIKTKPAINNPRYGKYIVRKHLQPKHKPRPIKSSKLRRERKKFGVTKPPQTKFGDSDGYWIYPKEYPIKSTPWPKLSNNKQQFEKMINIKVLKRTIMKKRKHHSRPRSQHSKSKKTPKPIKVTMNENRSKNTAKSNIFELELIVDPILRFHLEIDVKNPINTQTVFDCCPGSCCPYARKIEVYVASNPKSYDIEVSMPTTPIPYSVQVHVVNSRKPYDIEVYVSSSKRSNTRQSANESNKWKLTSKAKPPGKTQTIRHLITRHSRNKTFVTTPATRVLASRRPNLKPLSGTPGTTQLNSTIPSVLTKSSAKIASTLQWVRLSTHTNKDGFTSTKLPMFTRKRKSPITSSVKRPEPTAISFKISTPEIHNTANVAPITGSPKWPKATSRKNPLTNSSAKRLQSKSVSSTATSLKLLKKVAAVTAKLTGIGDRLSTKPTVYTASTMRSSKITVKKLPLKPRAGALMKTSRIPSVPPVSLLSIPKMLASAQNSTSASHLTTKVISLLGNSMKVSKAATNDLGRESPTFLSMSTKSSPNISATPELVEATYHTFITNVNSTGSYIKSLDAISTDKLLKRTANVLTIPTTFPPKIFTKLKQAPPTNHNITTKSNFTTHPMQLTETAEKRVTKNSQLPKSSAITISPEVGTLSTHATTATLKSRDMDTISSVSPISTTSSLKNKAKSDVTKHAPVINIGSFNRSTTYTMENAKTSSNSAVLSMPTTKSSATPIVISPSIHVTAVAIRATANFTEFTKILGTKELHAQNTLIPPLSTTSSSKVTATPEIKKRSNHISSALMQPSGHQFSGNYYPTSLISSKSILTKKTVIPRTDKGVISSSAYPPTTTILSQIVPTAPKKDKTATELPETSVIDKLLTTSLILISKTSLSKIKPTTGKAAPILKDKG